MALVASGHSHPSTVITSDALAESVEGLEPGWSEKRLGMVSRHVAQPFEHMSHFAVEATEAALDRAGWEPSSIDAIICGSSFVDDLLPATSSLIAQRIAPAALAFDMNSACASGPHALVVAESLLATRSDLSRVAICVAERPTAWADYSDRSSSVFWGDSAGCLLAERPTGKGFEVLGTTWAADAEFAERVRVRRGGHFSHDGRYSRRMVIDLTEKTCREVLGQHGLTTSDVKVFVGHQSNVPLLEALGDRLDIPLERQWHNAEWAGNQGGAGMVTAFSAGWWEHESELEVGDLALIAAVGGGYASGAALLRWTGS